MKEKYKRVDEVLMESSHQITSSPEAWMNFLRTASWSYKYRFEDQILIYAQRPDAKACAEYEIWNQKTNRWVRKNSKGIALFSEDHQRLRYVFDISDTDGHTNKPLRLWEVKKEDYSIYTDELSKKYHLSESSRQLEDTIYEMSAVIASDYKEDYLASLSEVKNESSLKYLEYDELEQEFLSLVINTISFEIMNRCGMDTERYFDEEDFTFITRFDSIETIGQIGAMCQDLCEIGMRDIASKARSLMLEDIKLNKGDEQKNERDSIQQSGRLPDAGVYSDGQNEEREIRRDEISISSEEQERKIILADSDQSAEYAPATDTGRSNESEIKNAGRSSEQKAEQQRNQSTEIEDRRKYTDPYHIQIESGIREAFANGIMNANVYFYIFQYNPKMLKSSPEIISFLQKHDSIEEKIEFIKSCYPDSEIEWKIDEVPLGMKKQENSLLIYMGTLNDPCASHELRWSAVVHDFEGMIISRYFDETVQVLSLHEQQTAIYQDTESLKKGIFFSKEEIEKVLISGSGFEKGKFRIYEHFKQCSDIQKNSKFLSNEYGIGGHHPVYGMVSMDYDGKGIRLARYREIGKNEIEVNLAWNKVAKYIQNLVAEERYLNKQEREFFPLYIQEKYKKVHHNQEISENQATQKPTPMEYKWSVGGTVFIDQTEYEIVQSDDQIILQDKDFPLFTESYTKDNFITKLKESDANDYLLCPVSERKELEKTSVNIEDDMEEIER